MTAPPTDGAPPTDAAGNAPDVNPGTPPADPFPLAGVKAARAAQMVGVNAHVEGPSYRNGDLFFAADGAGFGLMRVDASKKLYRYHPQLHPVGSTLLADGSLLICDHEHVLVQMFPDGKVATLPVAFQPAEFCNDISVDAAGNIWATARRSGFIYRISPTGQVSKAAGGLNDPNGIEVDPASKNLYVGTLGAILRLALPDPGAASPMLGRPERVAGANGPDGMALDAWGNIWVADYRAGHIAVLSPQGQTLATLNAGGPPINLTFGGKDGDTVYVTVDFKGIYTLGPIPGLRGFLHPGAPSYATKNMLNLTPANTPVN